MSETLTTIIAEKRLKQIVIVMGNAGDAPGVPTAVGYYDLIKGEGSIHSQDRTHAVKERVLMECVHHRFVVAIQEPMHNDSDLWWIFPPAPNSVIRSAHIFCEDCGFRAVDLPYAEQEKYAKTWSPEQHTFFRDKR